MAKTKKTSEIAPLIKIGKIVENKHISGSVSNLDPKEYTDYKVVVYVNTDQWYIHPYEEEKEGCSWASINKNGTWKINTVQRDFKADKVTALLVKRNDPQPKKIDNLGKIDHKAMIIRELINTPDYGKL